MTNKFGIITQVIFSLSEDAEYQVNVSGNTIQIDFQTIFVH